MNFKIRKFYVALATVVILVSAGFCWLSSRYVTPVLMYHHIAPDVDNPTHTVAPEHFAGQMKYLAEHGFRVAPMEEYVDAVIHSRQLPWKTVVLTFDDGYEDNYQNVFPVLKQYGFPWIVFIISDFIGDPGQMSVDQIKEMARSGVDIGAHTRNHAFLPDVTDPAELTGEITGSKKDLEDKLGTTVNIFSYPTGGFNDAVKREVQKAGYTAAVTTNRGISQVPDQWSLRRIKIKDKDHGFVLGVKLSGFYNAFRTLKAPDAPIISITSSDSIETQQER